MIDIICFHPTIRNPTIRNDWYSVVFILPLEMIDPLLSAGSSDIQEDHSEEQRVEEETVRGVHWITSTVNIIRGTV